MEQVAYARLWGLERERERERERELRFLYSPFFSKKHTFQN
jgi:hypothetical protein